MSRWKFFIRMLRSYRWIEEAAGAEHISEDMISRAPECIKDLIDKVKVLYAQEGELLILEKQIEYSVLQSQINPHFLYNTLECIRSEALLNDQMEIAEMTKRLSMFFRYGISNSEQIVTLGDEIDSVRNYFYIQKFRFRDRFNLEIDLEEESLLSCKMPRMVLQPIVENAIGHGLAEILADGVVRIKVFSTERKLYIIVSDNGSGMPQNVVDEINKSLYQPEMKARQAEKVEGHGIALSNVNGRIRLLYGDEYGMMLQSALNQGTDVEVVLPLIRA